MNRICIVSSHRAERGLLQPLIDRLEAHPEFELDLFSLDPAVDVDVNYWKAYLHLNERPDAVIVPCDRLEALAGALAAFNMGIPIIHFHAGDTGTQSNDEVYRAMISMMASVHLCNGPTARETVCDMLEAVGRSTEQVYDVGSTAMDDLVIDIALCPDSPYDLILYNPPINDTELIKRDLDEIEELLDPDVRTVWCYPNRDPGSDIIVGRINGVDVKSYTELARPQFFGLVSRAEHFIGNSSSMVCEAPVWLSPEQIIHIGDRNKHRSFDGIRPGGTDRIIKILEGIASGPV